jgi:hypothetical protein
MALTACTEPQCLYKGALYLYLTDWNAEEPWFDIHQVQEIFLIQSVRTSPAANLASCSVGTGVLLLLGL